jgi:hypothetical protein
MGMGSFRRCINLVAGAAAGWPVSRVRPLPSATLLTWRPGARSSSHTHKPAAPASRHARRYARRRGERDGPTEEARRCTKSGLVH